LYSFLDKGLVTWWWPNWRNAETCSQLQTTPCNK